MKGDWKYVLYLSGAFGLFLMVKLLSPKQFDWTITFAHEDKNPYGGYVLYELLPSIFPGKKVEASYQTVYELKDSLRRSGNFFILANSFNAADEDAIALLTHVNDGGSAFIAAKYWRGTVADTLGIETDSEYSFGPGGLRDTVHLRLVAARDSLRHYRFRRDNIDTWFNRFDTKKATVLARNSAGKAVTLRVRWGKGTIILNSTPLVFSNINILSGENHEFASSTLSWLPQNDVQWTGFYHVGRQEAATPLRVILRTETLRWAYFISIIALLVFMIFEMKRKQRIIPVLPPLENSTLEFVGTIGNLYYQNKEHKNIAEKKILFLLDQIRSQYWLSTAKADASFIQTLSNKTGKPELQVKKLFALIESIRGKPNITAEELFELNRQIELFTENKVKVS